jgi:hypothetical protein
VDNWKFIIPTAFGLWLLMPIAFSPGRPAWFYVAVGVGCFILIGGLVAYLILRNSGWIELARRYPTQQSPPGPWRNCRTVVMALVPLDDPGFEQAKVRWVSILRAATTDESFHLAPIPPLRPLLPALEIPWTAVQQARPFDARGWVRGPQEPEALIQLNYDPGYTGAFVELELREPTVFLQLPLAALGEGAARLPVTHPPGS